MQDTVSAIDTSVPFEEDTPENRRVRFWAGIVHVADELGRTPAEVLRDYLLEVSTLRPLREGERTFLDAAIRLAGWPDGAGSSEKQH